MTLTGMVWWTACFALLLWRCRQQIRALRASVEAPKPGPYDEPLPRCKCSQRGDPVEVEVHAVYDRTTHTGKGADPCGPGCEKYTTRVVCSKCWLTATNATPQPEWPPDVYPRPVPWRDTLPPVDAPGPRLAALRDLLETKHAAINRLANALSVDTYGGTVVSVTEHTAYQALHAEAVEIRREIIAAERAERAAEGLGTRRFPWGDAKSFGNAAAAMKPLLWTEPEYEEIHEHGRPEPFLRVCRKCGQTDFRHGEVIPIRDPGTGELLGAVRLGADGETHLA